MKSGDDQGFSTSLASGGIDPIVGDWAMSGSNRKVASRPVLEESGNMIKNPRQRFLAATSVILLSIASLGAPAQAQEWTPLDFSRFGSELTEPWIKVPNGDSGAPRQGWLNTADGFFTREVHLAYDYTDGDLSNDNRALARFHYPFSRRLWAGFELPFYQELGRASGVGDGTLTTQLMLVETRNLSLNTGVAFRLPFGAERVGGGVFGVEPQINLWSDIGSGFAVRGRVAWNFLDSGEPDEFVLNAAIGQTITEHERTPLGDFTYYVSGNYREPTKGRSFVSITPGIRTHLGGDLFFLAGVEVPVTESDFSERVFVQLVKGF